MEFSQPIAPQDQPGAAPAVGRPPQPTPDYGRLGPGSDVTAGSAQTTRRNPRVSRVAPLVAIAIGMLLAIAVSGRQVRHTVSSAYSNAPRPNSARSASTAIRQLEYMKPQTQAEALLEQAVAHSDGAVDQISSRVDHWQGKLSWDSQMATLTTAALNSNDMRVRESGIEVELAAYGLAKNPASLNYLVKTAKSSDHAQKIWALWALGLIGNRGVESERVVQILSSHLKDSDVDSRHWAVEGLALVGGGQTVPMLLAAMHDDPSPVVREEAACEIAQSGMFTREERLSAVPQLLNYADDPTLDAETHDWAFQALSDITGQRLSQDAGAWREWYRNQAQ